MTTWLVFRRWNLMANYTEHPMLRQVTTFVCNYRASKDDTINESLQTLPFLHKVRCDRLVRDFNLRR